MEIGVLSLPMFGILAGKVVTLCPLGVSGVARRKVVLQLGYMDWRLYETQLPQTNLDGELTERLSWT